MQDYRVILTSLFALLPLLAVPHAAATESCDIKSGGYTFSNEPRRVFAKVDGNENAISVERISVERHERMSAVRKDQFEGLKLLSPTELARMHDQEFGGKYTPLCGINLHRGASLVLLDKGSQALQHTKEAPAGRVVTITSSQVAFLQNDTPHLLGFMPLSSYQKVLGQMYEDNPPPSCSIQGRYKAVDRDFGFTISGKPGSYVALMTSEGRTEKLPVADIGPWNMAKLQKEFSEDSDSDLECAYEVGPFLFIKYKHEKPLEESKGGGKPISTKYVLIGAAGLVGVSVPLVRVSNQ